MKPEKEDSKDIFFEDMETPLTNKEMLQLETMAGLGMTQVQIARVLSISKRTFDRRLAQYPDMRETFNRGKALAIAKVSETAYNMAISGNNPTMTMFWLKCQARWKQEQIELTDFKPSVIERPSGEKVELTYKEAPDEDDETENN